MLLALLLAAVQAQIPPSSPPPQATPAAPIATRAATTPATTTKWPTREADFTARDFAFRSGERMRALRLHYTTLGTPHRDAAGEIDNAVMVLHGTGGTGKQFLSPQFADRLYGPGQPLDITRFFVILPDNIGHGGSSKPSDGLPMAFPKYDYDDMVAAQHRLLTEGQLQLEVLISRLEAEYKVAAGLEPAPFDTARWVTGEAADLKAFADLNRGAMAKDRDGNPVFLAKSAWEIGYVADRYPKVRFNATRER